jgi:hypothetical protein
MNLTEDEPSKIATALKKAGRPDFKPLSNGKGGSEKFRVTHGTPSPEGRYVIALGLKQENIDRERLKRSR